MKGIAMKLTVLRVILIPLLIFFYYFHPPIFHQWLTILVYVIACVSDYLDGYLARKLNEVSPFGAFLDPVADKLMVCSILIIVMQQSPEIWLMICSLIIIFREIWISALREWMAQIGKRSAVAVGKIGKWKTGVQMTALGFLIYKEDFLFLPVWTIGKILLIIAAFLTIYSMVDYSSKAWQTLKAENKDK